MIITICGSIKFLDEMHKAEKVLETLGHEVLTPAKKEGDSLIGVELKFRHMDKINKSDAILVMNITSEEIEDRIGGSTFLEIGFAHYKKKKIFSLIQFQINHILLMRLKQSIQKLLMEIIPKLFDFRV